MFKEIMRMISRALDSKTEENLTINGRIAEIVDEIEELEIKLASKLADVERWGDIDDVSDWRTVEVNKIKRIIEAKEKSLNTLTNV